jgi:hypothetical protein
MSSLQNSIQHSNSTTESKDNELAKMFEREFRSVQLKMISHLKEDSYNLGNQSKT